MPSKKCLAARAIADWQARMDASLVKVWHLEDSTYQVVAFDDGEAMNQGRYDLLHQGPLADCKAYVDLRAQGLI